MQCRLLGCAARPPELWCTLGWRGQPQLLREVPRTLFAFAQQSASAVCRPQQLPAAPTGPHLAHQRAQTLLSSCAAAWAAPACHRLQEDRQGSDWIETPVQTAGPRFSKQLQRTTEQGMLSPCPWRVPTCRCCHPISPSPPVATASTPFAMYTAASVCLMPPKLSIRPSSKLPPVTTSRRRATAASRSPSNYSRGGGRAGELPAPAGTKSLPHSHFSGTTPYTQHRSGTCRRAADTGDAFIALLPRRAVQGVSRPRPACQGASPTCQGAAKCASSSFSVDTQDTESRLQALSVSLTWAVMQRGCAGQRPVGAVAGERRQPCTPSPVSVHQQQDARALCGPLCSCPPRRCTRGSRRWPAAAAPGQPALPEQRRPPAAPRRRRAAPACRNKGQKCSSALFAVIRGARPLCHCCQQLCSSPGGRPRAGLLRRLPGRCRRCHRPQPPGSTGRRPAGHPCRL